MLLAQDEVVLITGKRSKRPRPPSPLTTSTTAGDSTGGSISGDLTRGIDREEEEDMAKCLILLAKGQTTPKPPPPAEVYQCKTCDKSFPSFQALGGHRASHKRSQHINNKPLLFALEEKKQLIDDNNNNKQEKSFSSHDESTTLSLQTPSGVSSSSPQSKRVRVHQCSICGAQFASGQALGGHMRRHRTLPAAVGGGGDQDQAKRPRAFLSLDLNLPAQEDDNHDHDHMEIKFPFVPQDQQVIVFSNSSLVDCHY